MIAKSFIIGLSALVASIAGAQATHLGNKAHAPVAEVELGERLKRSGTPPTPVADPQAEPVAVDADAPTTSSERKVRVVYPLPR